MTDTNVDVVDNFRRKIRMAHEANERVFQSLWSEIYKEIEKPLDKFTRKELSILFKSVLQTMKIENETIIGYINKPKIRRIK